MPLDIWPGSRAPLGATYDGNGVNFSVFSEVAERVDLCLFDDERETTVPLPERTSFCWHGYVPNLKPGQRYGYRVTGPWRPEEGLRCNPAKLLLDPYARAIDGTVRHEPAIFGHVIAPDGAATGDPNTEDSAPSVPRSVVVDPRFDWGDDTPPRRPLNQTVIYEVHVKGFTARRQDLPPEIRGTFAGLSHPSSVEYLQKLGVTAVELMPVHHFLDEGTLLERGLRNYWGYHTIGFFAPHSAYASLKDPVDWIVEFRRMVRTLHSAGIEVILDVVYNHTAEGNHLGPTLSLRGLDNRAYYRLDGEQPFYYTDYTGTGNTLNVANPFALQLVMDSLRYWVREMHVDGFRFDLASALARDVHHVDTQSAFFDVIQQDPVLSAVKLIAEPWDVGEGGYQVGNFPPLWSEWNGKYRDTVRDYWRGVDGTLAELASRLTGSADLYASNGRRAQASINFITSHDGFTLRDLVSYNEKHNETNGEENRDGESHNRSWNCGAEGPADDPAVNALRARQIRNLLTTLFVSQGVPMLLSGDECGRTQHGNNNAYCQDNEISWFDWNAIDTDLLEFTAHLIRLRTSHPAFARRRWLNGRSSSAADVADVLWLTPQGAAMTEDDWTNGTARSLMVFLNGCAISERDERGARIADDRFLLLVNAHDQPVDFALSGWGPQLEWRVCVDSRLPVPPASDASFTNDHVELEGRTMVILTSMGSDPSANPDDTEDIR